MIKECLLPSEVRVKNIEGDGNCLFRAIGSQLYGESDCHNIIRSACMDYVELNKEAFSGFVHEHPSIERYIQEKRRPGVWGDNIEIQALSDLYSIPVYIYEKVKSSKSDPGFSQGRRTERLSCGVSDYIFNGDDEFVYRLFCKIEPRPSKALGQLSSYYSNTRPIRLLYHNELHYDSLFFRKEHQTPIINLETGVIEARSIRGYRECKARDERRAGQESASLPTSRGDCSGHKPSRIGHPGVVSYYLLRKRALKQFPSGFESFSESDSFVSKSPLFSPDRNRYRDEPDSAFRVSCLDKISDGEAHFERLSLRSKQLYSKFISEPKTLSEKHPAKPAYFSKLKSVNNTAHLGVVDRYARDVQLSSHQKELRKLLTSDLPPLSSFQVPGKKCVAIYCPLNLKQSTFRN